MPVSPVYTPGTHQMAKIKAAMPAMPMRSSTLPAAPTMPPLPQPGGVSTQQPVVTSGGPPRAPGTGGFNVASAPSAGINSPGIQAMVQALMRRQGGGGGIVSPNQNMQGPNAQPTLGDLGGDIFGIKAKQAAALAAMQPPAPPPAAPVAPPQPPANWARQFFGSAFGGQYGNGNGMAKLNGWAQQNPQGVQRWADAGHVPAPTMMPQQRRTGAAGR